MSFRSSLSDLRGFDRAVFVVAAARFVNVLGSGIVYPFATLYFYGEVGIAFTLVGTGLFAKRQDTLMFNGYADEVASLYTGMDLAKFY